MKINGKEIRYTVEFYNVLTDRKETRYYEHYSDYMSDRKNIATSRYIKETIWVWAWDALAQCWNWEMLDDEY